MAKPKTDSAAIRATIRALKKAGYKKESMTLVIEAITAVDIAWLYVRNENNANFNKEKFKEAVGVWYEED